MSKEHVIAVASAISDLVSAGFSPPSGADERRMARVWLEDLGEFPAEAITAATVRYRRSGAEFWPRTGQIRQLALDTLVGTAEAAWADVSESVARKGWRKSEGSGWPIAVAAGVSRAGGWRQIGMCDHPATEDRLRKLFIGGFNAARTEVPARALIESHARLRLVQGPALELGWAESVGGAG